MSICLHNGQHLNGQHLNGQHLNGQHLNGQHLNGHIADDPRFQKRACSNRQLYGRFNGLVVTILRNMLIL